MEIKADSEIPELFVKRASFKPFQYPEVTQYKDAINHSYWLVSEWNFVSDIQDFSTKLTDEDREIIKRTLLAISQIEVAVKRFWTRLGDYFPKAEIEQVGISFGECEVRHADAYSHLLEVLGFNEDFAALSEVEAIQGRMKYLEKYLINSRVPRKYVSTLALFSIFVENVSLFSQFAIIKSYNKHFNVLKDIDNVVQATQKEELVHAEFGMFLINLLRQQAPEWFDEDFYEYMTKACIKAFNAEEGILDWIFESGEPSFLSKATLINFIKDRFNQSMINIGGQKIFDIDEHNLLELTWFNEEIYAPTLSDFFYKKPVTYSKKTQSITSGDLF